METSHRPLLGTRGPEQCVPRPGESVASPGIRRVDVRRETARKDSTFLQMYTDRHSAASMTFRPTWGHSSTTDAFLAVPGNSFLVQPDVPRVLTFLARFKVSFPARFFWPFWYCSVSLHLWLLPSGRAVARSLSRVCHRGVL